jgi:hypothetical protein
VWPKRSSRPSVCPECCPASTWATTITASSSRSTQSQPEKFRPTELVKFKLLFRLSVRRLQHSCLLYFFFSVFSINHVISICVSALSKKTITFLNTIAQSLLRCLSLNSKLLLFDFSAPFSLPRFIIVQQHVRCLRNFAGTVCSKDFLFERLFVCKSANESLLWSS